MRDDEVLVLMFLRAFGFVYAKWAVAEDPNDFGDLTCYYSGKDEPFGVDEFVSGSLTSEAWLYVEEELYTQGVNDGMTYRVPEEV